MVLQARYFYDFKKMMRKSKTFSSLIWLSSFLFAANSAAQEANSEISFRGENWSISQLPRWDRPNSDTYLTLPVILRPSGKWEVGGSIKEDGYEQIFVDLVRRQIGPDASNTDRNGKKYYCEGSKSENKKKWRASEIYIACSSFFYTAGATEKVAQAVIMCALVACLGGYDSDWFPKFRPSRFKKALASGLFHEVEKYVHAMQLTAIDKQVAAFNAETTRFLQAMDQIDPRGNDLEVLKQGETLLAKLEFDYKSDLENFEKANSGIDYSRGFSPKRITVEERRKAAIEEYETALIESGALKSALVLRIDQVNRARAAEQARLKEERMRIIDKIQILLKENAYYAATVDGALGPATQSAVQAFFSDFGRQPVSENVKGLLSEIESTILESAGPCAGSPTDQRYVACFTFDF
ncbi:peptidoglycan-binding protein [Gammaproteobacteria bacterium]|nr:peptidoglycan-binding protein [Gammaproteobacteria bacterium]